MESEIETLKQVAQRLIGADDQDVAFAKIQLREFAKTVDESGWPQIDQCSTMLSDLLNLAEVSIGELNSDIDVHAIVEFVLNGVNRIVTVIESEDSEFDSLTALIADIEEQWGEHLRSVMPDFESDPFDHVKDPIDDCSDETQFDQIGLILNTLSEPSFPEMEPSFPEVEPFSTEVEPSPPSPADRLAAPELQPMNLSDDTIEAFADDAYRCLTSIESSVMAYENSPEAAPLEQICRDLHTLKGASASIELSELAHFLHCVEDKLVLCTQSGSKANVDEILQCVDAVRKQLSMLSSSCGDKKDNVATQTNDNDVDRSPDSIRVQASQIDRLLDMLAELVMLRNRRDSQVEKLKAVNVEVLNCASRIRLYEEAAVNRFVRKYDQDEDLSNSSSISSLAEVANDLLEVGRCLRETFDPLVAENHVLSRFIRQFRGEMMELRRLPASGLFNRLQRIARDAARAEEKQIRVHVTGENLGLERSLHEKLFEPLMHIVRNSVSHGIEVAGQRTTAGKPPIGQLSIDARKGSNLFAIEVRDDGKGLDYDALRRKGIERGLLSTDRPVSHNELANLIFKSGFSTREEANEISGRGVGMDVVAATVESMHGWIEMESIPGQGTCVRVLVPRCSFIEHAMVFQTASQRFAIPTQFVKSSRRLAAKKRGGPSSRVLDFRAFLGIGDEAPAEGASIFLQFAGEHVAKNEKKHEEVELIVDSIIGPEEVVIRPLPSLLKSQNLFSGVTLSGCGAIMLLVDPKRLIENFRSNASIESRDENAVRAKQRILVVDDSLSSRRALVQKLARIQPMEIEQAADGAEAFRLISSKPFDAIFTDLDMPRMNGFELLKEMQSNESIRHIPVAVVSSRSDNPSRNTAKSLGANDYLVKPTTDSALIATLERLDLLHHA